MRARQRGFTLLELLIAMGLTALLLSSLVLALRVGTRAWQQGEARLRGARKEAEQARFLAHQVASLVPDEIASADPDFPGRMTVLEATSSRLRFLSTYGAHDLNRSGLLLVEYAVAPTGPGTFTLAERETPAGDEKSLFRTLVQQISQDPETGKTVITFRPFHLSESDLRLIPEVEKAGFEYLAPASQDRPPGWVSRFESGRNAPFPLAMRLRWQAPGNPPQEEAIPLRAHFLPREN